MVFTISIIVPVKSDTVADCHLVIFPVFPLNVRLVLFVPVHTVADPLTVPPTLAGFTVIVTGADEAGLPIAQETFEFKATPITSPLISVLSENVAALVPTVTLFFVQV